MRRVNAESKRCVAQRRDRLAEFGEFFERAAERVTAAGRVFEQQPQRPPVEAALDLGQGRGEDLDRALPGLALGAAGMENQVIGPDCPRILDLQAE